MIPIDEDEVRARIQLLRGEVQSLRSGPRFDQSVRIAPSAQTRDCSVILIDQGRVQAST